MKTIYLLRHARAAQGADLEDRDRPLNSDGIAECAKLTAHLRAMEIHLDLVLCSTATRVRETFAEIVQALTLTPASGPPQVQFVEALYLAGPSQLLDAIQTCPAEVNSVLLIAHNPGLEEITRALLDRPGAEQASRSFAGLPTAALVKISSETTAWADVDLDACQLEGVVAPI